MVANMYVERLKSQRGNKTYRQILLRESYREPGAPRSRVKHRTLLNLTRYPEADVIAIEMGLKCKNNLSKLRDASGEVVRLKQGRSAGAVWLLYRLAQRVGLSKALCRSQDGRRVLWQVMARLLEQGSRLSAVRLAREHAACEILGLDGFSENELYKSLDWLDARQAKIEDALYRDRHGDDVPQLFLYDVTSSYLEGARNEYGAYGYNRDGKRGKLQIVVGLLTDPDGMPVSVQVFEGNTQDPKTVPDQIRKLADRFGVSEVTLVGDRGMLKSAQMEALNGESFHYITSITKRQIEKLVKDGVFQMELFDEKLCEVCVEDGVRYILRRNPLRASEIAASRQDKYESLRKLVEKKNLYLDEHPRASVEVALRCVVEYAEKLRIKGWAEVSVEGRRINVERNQDALARETRLDGCYVLKTDVKPELADAEQLHARYKDLAQVEYAFRTMKTGHLELRPVFVRTAAHTRAHVFIVMLAYRLRRELEEDWRDLDITVEEGLTQLNSLCAQEVTIGKQAAYLTVPEPRDSLARLFAASNIAPPTNLPRSNANVATKRKLTSRRKKA